MSGVVRALGYWLMGFGLLCAPFALLASVLAEPRALGFWSAAGSALFLGGALQFATLGRPQVGQLRDALFFLVLAWFTTPLIAALPFASLPDISLDRAYFEAVSALTTTGFSPGFAGQANVELVIIWWNFLQWVGGAASVTGAIVVLAALNLTGPGVHRSVLFTLKRENILSRLLVTGRIAVMLYGAVTLVVFFVSVAARVPWMDAMCLAFSSVATGGLVLPGGEGDAAAIPLFPLIIATGAMVLGATNFAVHWEAWRNASFHVYRRDDEARIFIILLLVAALAALLFGAWRPEEGVRTVLSGVSLATSAGWSMGPLGIAAAPMPFILMFAFIGGSPVSTAGGMKVVRLAILLRYVVAELRRLAHPSSVSGVKFRDRQLGQRSVLGLLLYVIGYGVALAITAMGCALAGGSLDTALAAATAAIGNLGPALHYTAPTEAAALLDTPAARAFLIVAMVAGRLEILGLVAVLLPTFWRR